MNKRSNLLCFLKQGIFMTFNIKWLKTRRFNCLKHMFGCEVRFFEYCLIFFDFIAIYLLLK